MSNTKPKSSKVSFINYFPSDGAEEFLIRVRYQSYYHSVLLSSLLKEKESHLEAATSLLVFLCRVTTPSAMISSFTTKFQESLQVSSPSSPEIFFFKSLVFYRRGRSHYFFLELSFRSFRRANSLQ